MVVFFLLSAELWWSERLAFNQGAVGSIPTVDKKNTFFFLLFSCVQNRKLHFLLKKEKEKEK
jgi:hypothetical protein